MQQQREKIKEAFWAKFVKPADIRLRAITGNNEALFIRGTAKELWEFIDEKLDNQLQRIIKEIEVEERSVIGKLNQNLTKREKAWVNSGLNLGLETAIKIVEEYK